jgi:hypothetical protein
MRVRFAEAVRQAWPAHGWIVKPAAAPPGYTPNTVVTEWLTLNCREPWASQGQGDRLEVWFASEDDAHRARLHFGAQDLWRGAPR